MSGVPAPAAAPAAAAAAAPVAAAPAAAAPAAAAPAGIPTAPGVLAQPLTYAEFYRVATNDPHSGDPTTVFASERPSADTNGNRPTPADLLEALVADPNPDAYMGFYQMGPMTTPRSFVVYRVAKVP